MVLNIAALLAVDLLAALGFGVASRSRSFFALIVAYALVMAATGALSLASSMPAHPGGTPSLLGSDGEGYFDDALQLSSLGIENYRELITSNYAGYQILLAACFAVFGPRLVVAVAVNHLLVLGTIHTLRKAVTILTGSSRAARLACLAFMLTTAHLYYAMLVLKEPAIGLAFALMLFAVTDVLKGRGLGVRAIAITVVALAILVTMRGVLLLFVPILFGLLANLFAHRRSNLVFAMLGLAGLVSVALPLAQEFTSYSLDLGFITDTITLNTVISATLAAGDVDVGGVVGRISGAYLALPFALKAVLFPVPTGLQLVLPFDFWSAAFLHDHFAAFLSHNLNPLWFLFVAVWALFAVVNYRRIDEPLLRRFLLAGVVFYVVIAVIYGGAIPRYGAPALLFVYPAIGYWWDRSRVDPAVRGRVHRFFAGCYLALLALALPYLGLNLVRLL